jgi:tetratricopeptide (TPR) repeat protein
MGQLEDALKKWELLLQVDPAHRLAKSYANGTRRELGLPLLEEPASVAPVQAQTSQGDEDLEKLLREAVQLYDMGLTGEAISKWERVLVLDPQQVEVQGYLQQARKELSQAGPATPPPPPPSPQAPETESVELKLRQAEHLLSLQRHEEAAFTFQQALRLAPGDAAALAGLERCRKPSKGAGSAPALDPRPAPGPGPAQALDTQKRIEMVIVAEGALGGTDPGAVAPPASLTQAPAPTRQGLPLPERLKALGEQLPWLRSPQTLALLGGGALLGVMLLFWLRGHFKDQELTRAVQAAKAAAIAPLAQQTQVLELAESPASVREEAEATLVSDPLRAYLRAEHLVARVPDDAAAAQLFEKTRTQLPGGVTGASLPEFQKHLQHGDLEAAAKVMDALLRAQPGDADLRGRAARLYLQLCAAHVGQGKWEEAKDDLLRGRALVPNDKSWQARLQLLERVKAMPKAQRSGWIPLLG